MYVFVVPTYSRTDLLARCIQSLKRLEPDFARWKVVLVHDGGPELVRNWLSASFGGDPQVRLILKSKNEGFSKTVNAGIAVALAMDADRIVLTNDDIEFRQPLIDACEKAFALDPKSGIVGAKLVYPNGMVQHAGMRRSGSLIGHRFHLMSEAHPPVNEPVDVLVTGALMALRTSMVRAIGALDPRFFMACEDVDYCMTAIMAGWRVVYWPKFTAIHAEGASRGRTDKQKGPKFVQAEREGYRLLQSKWGESLREQIRVDGRETVAYVLAADADGTVDQALVLQAERLSRRGWPTRILVVGGPPGQNTLSPSDIVGVLGSFRGTKIAGSPSAAQWVADGLKPGDSGFVYVRNPEAFAHSGIARLKIRPLCENVVAARMIGMNFRVEPAVIGLGTEGERWQDVINRLEDVLDQPHQAMAEAPGSQKTKSFAGFGQDQSRGFTSRPASQPTITVGPRPYRVSRKFGTLGNKPERGYTTVRRKRR